MPRNKLDNCMFCTDEEPCEAHAPKPTKKSAARPRKPVDPKPVLLPESSTVPSTVEPRVGPADLKAAMQAMKEPEPVAPPPSSVSQAIHQAAEETHDEEAEFADALEALVPILHRDELKKYSHVRAARWKERRNAER